MDWEILHDNLFVYKGFFFLLVPSTPELLHRVYKCMYHIFGECEQQYFGYKVVSSLEILPCIK